MAESVDAQLASLRALRDQVIAGGATSVTLPTGHSVSVMRLDEIQRQIDTLEAEKAAQNGGTFRRVALGGTW